MNTSIPKNRRIYTYIDVFFSLLTLIFLIFRIHYGVDFTDEAWYVAEPYAIVKGAIPYIDNITQAPGFTIPLYLIYWGFYRIQGTTEGVFLFSRYLYVIWSVLVNILTVTLIRKQKNIDFSLPWIVVFPTILNTFCLFDINYNTIGQIYLPLILILIYSDYSVQNRSIQIGYGFLAGIITARAVIGTPQLLIAVFLVICFLLFTRKTYRLLGYCLGGGIIACAVIITLCIKSSVKDLINGLHYLLFDQPYFQTAAKNSFIDRIKFLFWLYKPFFLCGLVSLILKVVFRKKRKLFVIGCICVILLFFGYGTYRGLFDIQYFMRYTWFFSIIVYSMLWKMDTTENIKPLILVCLLYMACYLFSGFTNIYGFNGRHYWLIVPSILSICSLRLPLDYLIGKRRYSYCFILLFVLLFLLVYHSQEYVYRDSPIKELNVRIESGVWKGCYTTKVRASAIEDVETCIRMNTQNTDEVLVPDTAAFAYLMSDGKVCSISTLTAPIGISANNPQQMYNYFIYHNAVPDVILYVDYGRYEKMSKDIEDLKFNLFLQYYRSVAEQKSEELSVTVYRIEDKEQAWNYIMRIQRE